MKGNTTSVVTLENLHCADCAAKLEKAVARLPGVETAQVNLVSSKMTVRHLGNEGPIRALVAQQGYLAKPEKTNFWLEPRTLATLGAAFLMLAAVIAPAGWRIFLFIPAVVIGGWFPALAGVKNVFLNKNLDINFLMTIAVMGAIAIGEAGEAATVVLLFALSHSLEAYTLGRTRRSVQNLIELAPSTAWLDADGALIATPTADLRPGQWIVVKPGERIPVDGTIRAGRSELNQAQLTGEALPISRGPGEPVFAGSINGSGQLSISVDKTSEDSSLARIVAMVEEAATSRPPIQQFIDSFARWYTPLVIVLALVIAVVPPLFVGLEWSGWLYRGLTLLVVACPCALVISTPVSIVSALGNAARRGVLIKNGAALEMAASTEVIAFDKTGTLTQGEPRLAAVRPAPGCQLDEAISLAAAVELGSGHPLAKAVLAVAKERGTEPARATAHRTLPGHGAMATVAGTTIYAVSPAYARQELGLAVREPGTEATQVILARSGAVLAELEFRDRLREETVETLGQLKALGVNTTMLTGDNEGAAAEIAALAETDAFYAHLLPEDKLRIIKELGALGPVMMVGDGINDAPALAAATVGVAMGAAGSDAALESADIALMGDDIGQLPFLLRLSRKALSTIRVNTWFAIAIKALAVALVFPGWLSLWLAILADTGAAVLVTINGMRLLKSS